MKLKPNPEYVKRHLFVVVVMTALGGWFGYDGFVRYPRTDAGALYAGIEGREAAPGTDLEGFKAQKIRTQYGFTLISLLAAAAVGLRLLAAVRFDFEFDETHYTFRGKRRPIAEIGKVDRSLWKSKGILRFDGITLDAWHHLGVREFEGRLNT